MNRSKAAKLYLALIGAGLVGANQPVTAFNLRKHLVSPPAPSKIRAAGAAITRSLGNHKIIAAAVTTTALAAAGFAAALWIKNRPTNLYTTGKGKPSEWAAAVDKNDNVVCLNPNVVRPDASAPVVVSYKTGGCAGTLEKSKTTESGFVFNRLQPPPQAPRPCTPTSSPAEAPEMAQPTTVSEATVVTSTSRAPGTDETLDSAMSLPTPIKLPARQPSPHFPLSTSYPLKTSTAPDSQLHPTTFTEAQPLQQDEPVTLNVDENGWTMVVDKQGDDLATVKPEKNWAINMTTTTWPTENIMSAFVRYKQQLRQVGTIETRPSRLLLDRRKDQNDLVETIFTLLPGVSIASQTAIPNRTATVTTSVTMTNDEAIESSAPEILPQTNDAQIITSTSEESLPLPPPAPRRWKPTSSSAGTAETTQPAPTSSTTASTGSNQAPGAGGMLGFVTTTEESTFLPTSLTAAPEEPRSPRQDKQIFLEADEHGIANVYESDGCTLLAQTRPMKEGENAWGVSEKNRKVTTAYNRRGEPVGIIEKIEDLGVVLAGKDVLVLAKFEFTLNPSVSLVRHIKTTAPATMGENPTAPVCNEQRTLKLDEKGHATVFLDSCADRFGKRLKLANIEPMQTEKNARNLSDGATIEWMRRYGTTLPAYNEQGQLVGEIREELPSYGQAETVFTLAPGVLLIPTTKPVAATATTSSTTTSTDTNQAPGAIAGSPATTTPIQSSATTLKETVPSATSTSQTLGTSEESPASIPPITTLKAPAESMGTELTGLPTATSVIRTEPAAKTSDGCCSSQTPAVAAAPEQKNTLEVRSIDDPNATATIDLKGPCSGYYGLDREKIHAVTRINPDMEQRALKITGNDKGTICCDCDGNWKGLLFPENPFNEGNRNFFEQFSPEDLKRFEKVYDEQGNEVATIDPHDDSEYESVRIMHMSKEARARTGHGLKVRNDRRTGRIIEDYVARRGPYYFFRDNQSIINGQAHQVSAAITTTTIAPAEIPTTQPATTPGAVVVTTTSQPETSLDTNLLALSLAQPTPTVTQQQTVPTPADSAAATTIPTQVSTTTDMVMSNSSLYLTAGTGLGQATQATDTMHTVPGSMIPTGFVTTTSNATPPNPVLQMPLQAPFVIVPAVTEATGQPGIAVGSCRNLAIASTVGSGAQQSNQAASTTPSISQTIPSAAGITATDSGTPSRDNLTISLNSMSQTANDGTMSTAPATGPVVQKRLNGQLREIELAETSENKPIKAPREQKTSDPASSPSSLTSGSPLGSPLSIQRPSSEQPSSSVGPQTSPLLNSMTAMTSPNSTKCHFAREERETVHQPSSNMDQTTQDTTLVSTPSEIETTGGRRFGPERREPKQPDLSPTLSPSSLPLGNPLLPPVHTQGSMSPSWQTTPADTGVKISSKPIEKAVVTEIRHQASPETTLTAPATGSARQQASPQPHSTVTTTNRQQTTLPDGAGARTSSKSTGKTVSTGIKHQAPPKDNTARAPQTNKPARAHQVVPHEATSGTGAKQGRLHKHGGKTTTAATTTTEPIAPAQAATVGTTKPMPQTTPRRTPTPPVVAITQTTVRMPTIQQQAAMPN